ncbi:hypothetical protein Ancab_008210 [Ancistrocladus abbreviatus]
MNKTGWLDPYRKGDSSIHFKISHTLETPGLCGFPLSKKCGQDEAPQQSPTEADQDEDSEGLFNWKTAIIGYACGTILALIAGYCAVIASNPVWLLRLAHQVETRVITPPQKHTGRRGGGID